MSLSHNINTSTRALHTRLNALILSLLPLALPPHTSTPVLYAQGMSNILCVYEGFEGAIKRVGEGGESDRCGEKGQEGSREVMVERLQKVWMPELERAGRLRRDLSRLHVESFSHDTGPKLKALTQHISSSTAREPHLLLAYTWLLYMALFSGGRYIRARLREAGAEFWMTTGVDKEREKGGDGDIGIDKTSLSFWNFDGEADGEDVKAEFKQRFGEIEEWLTGEEREEVVQEAVFIMESLMGVVEEIAETVGKEDPCPKAAGRRGGVERDEPSVRWLCLKHILPIGMFELITGVSKAVVMGIESLDGKT